MDEIITSVKQMPFKLSYYTTPFRGLCINVKCGKPTDRVFQFSKNNGGFPVEEVRACDNHCAIEYYKMVVGIF